MMNRIPAYCELDNVLDWILKGPVKPDHLTEFPHSFDDFHRWNSAYLFITSKIHIYFDRDFDPEYLSNELFNAFLRDCTARGTKLEGSIDPDEIENYRDEFSTELPNMLIISDSEIIREIADRFGMLKITFDELPMKVETISKVDTILVSHHERYNELLGWDVLFLPFVPMNSAWIIDRYLFCTDGSIQNLLNLAIELSKNMVGKERKLGILAATDKCAKGSEYIRRGVNHFITALKDEKVDVVVNIYLLSNSNEFHSRKILTNYYLINPDNSFYFFNRNLQVREQARTTIRRAGIGAPKVLNEIMESLDSVSNAIKDIDPIQYCPDFLKS